MYLGLCFLGRQYVDAKVEAMQLRKKQVRHLLCYDSIFMSRYSVSLHILSDEIDPRTAAWDGVIVVGISPEKLGLPMPPIASYVQISIS